MLELCVVICVLIVAALILVISNCTLSVSRYEIKADGELKILLLSDLHKKKFGKAYDRLLQSIPKEKFDIVCFTGDLVSRTETDFEKKIALMSRLSEIAPVFFVAGNHECDIADVEDRLYSRLESVGVRVLRNEKAVFFKNGVCYEIAGLEIERRFYKNPDGGYKNLPEMTSDYLKERLGEKGESYTVLLAHSPFEFESFCEWRADLCLCGHVHGGAVRLPFVKGLLSPERKFFPKYSAGAFQKESTSMIVSRGLGKLRVFNSSEICIIELKK